MASTSTTAASLPARNDSLQAAVASGSQQDLEIEAIRPVRPIVHRSAPKRGILKPPGKPAPSQVQKVLTTAAAAALRQVPESTLSSWRASFNRWTNPAGPQYGNAPIASTSTAPDPSLFASLTQPSLSMKPLKSVRFTMATLKIVYPINQTGSLPPSDEADTRSRVESEFNATKREWTGRDLLQLYTECCRTREEPGIELIRATLRDAGEGAVRTLDLTDQPISHSAAEALGDVLSVNFGLRKLVLAGCSLDDEALKPILHALLVSGSLPTLSLANNRRIRAKGWRLVAVFVRKAPFLRFLDISDNSLDKRTIDMLNQAIGREGDTRSLEGREDAAERESYALPCRLAPEAPLLRDRGDDAQSLCQLESLRLENCGLKIPALESLSSGVRTSGIKHVSLRRNKISATGAVALAVMLRDYEALPGSTLPVATTALDSPVSSAPPSPSLNRGRLLESNNSLTARLREQTLQPPPKRTAPTNGIRAPSPTKSNDEAEEDAAFGTERRSPLANKMALLATQEQDLRRDALHKQLEALPRVGALATLDIRSNDIRDGVVYIAQVLKRNRMLRILNLSDNKIDVAGLAAVADALRLNATLETLDMSKNPCCGPGLDGINALRTTFAHNTSLVRVFLNGTDLMSEGAICLAEFLPEVRTLLHLDLTENYEIDIAGLMALAVALKMNYTIRCLDLNIPANDPDFARLSQDILTSCIRNTELAQEQSAARGIKQKIAAPILKSAVARNLESQKQHLANGGTRNLEDLYSTAKETRELLMELIEAAERMSASISQQSLLREVTEQAQLVRDQVVEAVRARPMLGTMRQDLLKLSDELEPMLDRARAAATLKQSPFRRPSMEAALARARDATSPISTPKSSPRPDTGGFLSPTPESTVQASSPTFSIVDSDEDSGDEERQRTAPQQVPGLLITGAGESETSSVTTSDDNAPSSPVDLRLEEAEKARALEESDELEIEDPSASGEELRKVILETPVPDKSPRALPAEPIEDVPEVAL